MIPATPIPIHSLRLAPVRLLSFSKLTQTLPFIGVIGVGRLVKPLNIGDVQGLCEFTRGQMCLNIVMQCRYRLSQDQHNWIYTWTAFQSPPAKDEVSWTVSSANINPVHPQPSSCHLHLHPKYYLSVRFSYILYRYQLWQLEHISHPKIW